MQAELKVTGPLQIVCRTPADSDRKPGDPVYHECLLFGGSLRFASDRRIEGRFEQAIFLAEISPRAINGFEGRAQQVFVTRLLALREATPSESAPAGAAR